MRHKFWTIVLFLMALPQAAMAANPFGVGISEGGGTYSGVFGWILAQQLF